MFRGKTAAAAVVAATFWFCATSHAADLHVSAAAGADTVSCGAVNAPCKTIRQGIKNAGAGTTLIKIATGNYPENNQITASVAGLTLQGGWNETFTARSCDPARTVLSPDSPLSEVLAVIAGAGVTIDLALECLNFQGTGQKGLQITASGPAAGINFIMADSIISSFTTHGMYFWANNNGNIIAEVSESIIRDNIQAGVSGQGGAGMRVSASNSGNADITLSSSKILDNSCLSEGGGIFLQRELGTLTAFIENTIIAGNRSSTNGGGISAVANPTQGGSGNMTFNLLNNTLSNNSAQGSGGGIYIYSDSNMVHSQILNTIIWGNLSSANLGHDIYMSMNPFPDDDSGIDADYSIVGDVEVAGGNYIDGAHNLNIDPRLNSSFHLATGSPAIDQGLCGSDFIIYKRLAPWDDIDGDSRPGYGEIAGCDIGADEFNSFLCFPVKNQFDGVSIICM